MNDLVKAAIDALDLIEKIDTGIYSTDEVVSNLRAAVERAERQEAVGFEEWWDTNADLKYKFVPIGQAKQLWNAATTAAQQAERERIKDLLRQSSDWFEDDQMAQANWLLEKIDGPDGI